MQFVLLAQINPFGLPISAKEKKEAIKLPATEVLEIDLQAIPSLKNPIPKIEYPTFQDIYWQKEGKIIYLHFDIYNGAFNPNDCRRIQEALIQAKEENPKIIVLMGGSDLWCNGIDLNFIEASNDPAQAAWENIQAIDDLILEMIESPEQLIITALQGNAGAGGVAMALAGDKVLARTGIVFNPHTKNMGLYGSEYWTYLLPKRIGKDKAKHFTESCLPWGTAIAKEIGLIDASFGKSAETFRLGVKKVAEGISQLSYFDKLIKAKKLQRQKDERIKPLERYRAEELAQMHDNFFKNDEGFHEKRKQFVFKQAPENSEHLSQDWYSSRRKIYRKRKWESIEYQA